jgi:nucleoid-associated protein YgaU
MSKKEAIKNSNKTQKRVAAKEQVSIVENEKTKTSFFNFLRFGESYTSLILGIVVVIIATVLLLSFVHNRSTVRKNNIQVATQQNQNDSKKLAQQKSEKATIAPTTQLKISSTPAPTKIISKALPKVTLTAIPTQAKIQKQQQYVANNSKESTYIVADGDTLWSIAEKQYKSGYNWVDIARVNNLNDPGLIHSGSKLILPKVESKIATINNGVEKVNVSVVKGNTVASDTLTNKKITSTSYTIVKGDNLWTIAVRAYGDGYQWVKIAQANNITNPGIIHSGNSLKIPRA